MDYIRCKKCNNYHWSNEPCAKKWQVRDADKYADKDWIDIFANSADEAAEKFCEQHDARSDYEFISSGGADAIEVLDLENGTVSTHSVEARIVSSYSARTLQAKEKNEH